MDPQPEEEVTHVYRVGRHQSQNIYRRDQYIGVMFSPDDAATVVRVLNDVDRPSRVGDLIGPNDTTIPDDVLEVVNSEGDTWRRAVGQERYAIEDDVMDFPTQEYEWVTTAGGGWATTAGMLVYAPLRVTKVAERP